MGPTETEHSIVDSLQRDLVRRYGKRVHDDVMQEIVRDCFARWSSARIQAYVPLLAYRCAKDRLAELAAEHEKGGNGKVAPAANFACPDACSGAEDDSDVQDDHHEQPVDVSAPPDRRLGRAQMAQHSRGNL